MFVKVLKIILNKKLSDFIRIHQVVIVTEKKVVDRYLRLIRTLKATVEIIVTTTTAAIITAIAIAFRTYFPITWLAENFDFLFLNYHLIKRPFSQVDYSEHQVRACD